MRLSELGPLDTRGPAPFRYRSVGDRIVITNYEGRWLSLSRDEFAAFATGKLTADTPLHTQLSEHNFLRDSYDVDAAADALRRRKGFIHYGPNLHLMVVTLRCNETCVYCHASRADMDRVDTDMSAETAERCVDLALASTSPAITIEFQGGEPLVAFDTVKHTIEYALSRNREVGKQLEFTMVSNMSLMTEDKLAYLLDHRVQLCTSIDGPKALHDKQRILPRARSASANAGRSLTMVSAFDEATRWIARINEAYIERGLDPTLYHVEALLTTTKGALHQAKAVVDTYVALGCRALFLRPIDPFGFADKTKRIVDYPRSEYLRFYAEALDHIIELNRQGVEILERYAAIFLTKILSGHDPNFLDIRSPGGAGTGQLAYNYDGKIFSSDEGRMLHEMGDSTFMIGEAETASYRELVGHPTIRAMALASNLDQQPDCVNCAYQPYCGTQPEHNHKMLGTMFGRMRESPMCAVHKGIQDILFERLARGGEVRTILERWTTVRARDHFVHDPTEP